MQYLRQSTASQEGKLGAFLDDTDGNTPETGLTITNTDIKLTKNGSTTETNKNSGGGTHVAGGRYLVVYDATDTDTLGNLEVDCHVAGALAVHREYVILPAAVFDALVLGTDLLNINVAEISDDSTAADNLKLQYDTTGLSGETFPASQSQVGNLATGSAAISTVSESQLLTTGTEVNDYTVTDEVDQTYHEISDDAGALEIYYQFNVGGNGVAAEVRMTGRLFSANDSIGVYAYNWGGASWDQIGAMNGAGGSSDGVSVFNLLTRHTGTGANLGKVRIRGYAASGLTSSTMYIDQAIVSYAVVAQSVGYADGKIWVDTNASNTNTENFVDGTADNPISTWAAALTLSGQLNITRFHIVNGSAITLTGNCDNYNITGQGYTLALNNQSIASAYIFGATISGIGTGGGTVFEDCPVGNVSLEPSIMRRCFYFGTITNIGTGDWFINDPRSRVAGSGAIIFDFGVAVGNTNLNIRASSGGWQLESMGDTGTDVASLEGWGQVIEGTCTGGAVTIRGNFTTSGITNLTLSDDARFDSVQLVDDMMDEGLASHNVGGSLAKAIKNTADIVQLDGSISDAGPTTADFDTDLTGYGDGYFEDSMFIFTDGAANKGIGLPVTGYTSATGNFQFAVPDDWPITPVNTDPFVIYALHVHPISQIQSGLATEAKQDTAQTSLNTIAGYIDTEIAAILNDTSTTLDGKLDQIIALTGTDGVVLSAAQMNQIADHILRRSLATARAGSDGDSVIFRSLLGAVSKLTNKVAITGTDLIIYEENDTSSFGTQALTTDAAAEPIIGMDTT
jgi:hypothetical protein